MRVVRANGLEGVVAKRLGSAYKPGDRSGNWVKVRANRAQELVVGGVIPASNTFDSILVGYYSGRDLMYASRIRSGFSPASRLKLFSRFATLFADKCPFRNLPDKGKGRWGEGLTAEDMNKCRWLKPKLVAWVEFLEWTSENRLRHPRFVGLRDDRRAREVTREP
jgi:bifunctional non-homologous end joining protein LigD